MTERIPLLQLGRTLLVSIQVELDDQRVLRLEQDLTERISKVGATGVVIDISAVTMVDSFIGRVLANIAQVSRVLGAETVVVGMQPAVAITLVELGIPLTGLQTALNVDRGLALLAAARPPDVAEAADGSHDHER